MVREFEERTRWVRWRLLDYPDYHVEAPGGCAGVGEVWLVGKQESCSLGWQLVEHRIVQVLDPMLDIGVA